MRSLQLSSWCLGLARNQEPDSVPPPLPPHMASYPQAAGWLSSHRLQLPATYKLTRPGDPKHSSSPDHSNPYTHTHTPVDTQNGVGVRQHAGGTGGDHAVKWIGPFFSALLIYCCGGRPSIVTLTPEAPA